jgi:hypothetical protein
MGTDHMAEFQTAVRTREQNLCTPRDAYYSTATVQLGMIAYEMKQRIQWDQSQQSIVNNNKAARLMKRPYRSPYTHPFTSH